MPNKIAIIGAGNVGATAALFMAQKNLGNIVLFDIVEGRPQGLALDLSQCVSADGVNNVRPRVIDAIVSRVVGTNDYADTADADLIVICAGIPRRPGMTREDLQATNAAIVSEAAKKAIAVSPNAIMIVVTNPMDQMCDAAWQATGLPRERLIGMGGVLDAMRFAYFISEALGVPASDVETMVLGGHGDEMVPVSSAVTVKGAPLASLAPQETVDALVERTRRGGAEIVALLKTGSAFYTPGRAVAEMADAILNDRHKRLPCSCLLQGEFGLSDLFIGVPAILSRRGLESIEQITLTESEMQALKISAEKIKSLQA
jgi:malate dehydrogenase